jgi:hypothetical protein
MTFIIAIRGQVADLMVVPVLFKGLMLAVISVMPENNSE